jgi:hypothetical protein
MSLCFTLLTNKTFDISPSFWCCGGGETYFIFIFLSLCLIGVLVRTTVKFHFTHFVLMVVLGSGLSLGDVPRGCTLKRDDFGRLA